MSENFFFINTCGYWLSKNKRTQINIRGKKKEMRLCSLNNLAYVQLRKKAQYIDVK